MRLAEAEENLTQSLISMALHMGTSQMLLLLVCSTIVTDTAICFYQ